MATLGCVCNYIMIAPFPNGGSLSTLEQEPHPSQCTGSLHFQAPNDMPPGQAERLKGREMQWINSSVILKQVFSQHMDTYMDGHGAPQPQNCPIMYQPGFLGWALVWGSRAQT